MRFARITRLIRGADNARARGQKLTRSCHAQVGEEFFVGRAGVTLEIGIEFRLSDSEAARKLLDRHRFGEIFGYHAHHILNVGDSTRKTLAAPAFKYYRQPSQKQCNVQLRRGMIAFQAFDLHRQFE